MIVEARHIQRLIWIVTNDLRSDGVLVVRRGEAAIITSFEHYGHAGDEIELLDGVDAAERWGTSATDEQAAEIAEDLNREIASGDGLCHCEHHEKRRARYAESSAARRS